jgi:hypothetical protein
VTAYYVMFGHPERRRWEDARRYSFVSAGGGPRWSQPLHKLAVGDDVLVHLPGAGYVGHGVVLAPMIPIKDFTVSVDGRHVPLLDLPLVSPGIGADVDDTDLCEYAVPVTWHQAVPGRQAYWRPGLFYKRTTVWPFENADDLREVIDNL